MRCDAMVRISFVLKKDFMIAAKDQKNKKYVCIYDYFVKRSCVMGGHEIRGNGQERYCTYGDVK
jgi:hypothetical protein